MITADAVVSVTFVDAPVTVPATSSSGRGARVGSGRTDRIVAVAPIRGLAAVPVSGDVFDMMAHVDLASASVVALQPDDV